MFVIGRGLEYATAREIALKLTETCRVAAEPLTATDLVHGPLAALDPLFPVWAIASPDESLRAVVEAAARARMAGAAHRRERERGRRDRGRLVLPPGAGRGRPDLRAAPLRRPGPALRRRARAREGARRRQSRAADEGYARPMSKRTPQPDGVARPQAPYSPVVVDGDLVYTAGQVALRRAGRARPGRDRGADPPGAREPDRMPACRRAPISPTC